MVDIPYYYQEQRAKWGSQIRYQDTQNIEARPNSYYTGNNEFDEQCYQIYQKGIYFTLNRLVAPSAGYERITV